MADNKDIKNLRNRPKAAEYAELEAERGPGKLGSINAYLKNDPVSFFYNQFKNEQNRYLRDNYWSEAARRGEGETLASLLNATKAEGFNAEMFDMVNGYGDRMDYDSYMLSLQAPHLDNTNKIDRIHEESGYNFGKFTDQEWALEILKNNMARWDAEIIEEYKSTRDWFTGAYQDTLAQIGGASANIIGGASNFIGDLWNIGEGALNIMFNWTKDEEWSQRYLAAFENDDQGNNPFANWGQWLLNASFEWQRQWASTVNAVKAHDEGYRLGEDDNWLAQVEKSVGVGTGMDDNFVSWGRWMNGGTQAIGYMLPTMLLAYVSGGTSTAATAGAGAAKVGAAVRSGIFYAGIFSGMVKDTVMDAKLNGISYKSLDAGQVLSNAAIKAGVQFAIEKGLDLILGSTAINRLLGIGNKASRVGSQIAVQGAAKGGAKAFSNVAMSMLKDAGQEGLEEVLQELSDSIIDYSFGGRYRERAIDNFSIQALTDSFIIGALTSIVIGSVQNVVTYGPNSSRETGMNEDGTTFQLGFFQSISYAQAVEAMQEWYDTAHNENKSVDERARAMLQLEMATTTLGSVYKGMGVDRATTAETILKDVLSMDAKEQSEIIKQASKYTTQIWSEFMAKRNLAKFVSEATKTKIKKALSDKQEVLRENNVTEISEAITKDTVASPDSVVSNDNLDKLKGLLDKLGIDAFVGVDGQLVTKSDEVVFVNSDLLAKGDFTAIIKGIAYDTVTRTVNKALTSAQKNLITKTYKEVTGQEGTLDDAISALLFDKHFYTYVLLKMEERSYGDAAFTIISTIDQLLTGPLTEDVKKGTITEKAYRGLLDKVKHTMQAGLVNYATQYTRLDLGAISNTVLPLELKTHILQHKNVLFTDAVNEGVKNTVTEERGKKFDELLAQVVDSKTPAILITKLKEKARSNNYNDRVDAYTTLVAMTLRKGSNDRLIYLPSLGNSSKAKYYADIIKTVETGLGNSIKSVIDGTHDVSKMSPEFKDFFDVKNPKTINERLSQLRYIIFSKSGGQLTINHLGMPLEILDKSKFLKARYQSVDGEANLKQDLLSGDIATLKDLVSPEVAKGLTAYMLSLPIILDASISSANAIYNGTRKFITINPDKVGVLNSLLHEITHHTQNYYRELTKDGQLLSAGGVPALLSSISAAEARSLVNYIGDNFPIVSEYLKNNTNYRTDNLVVYFLLEGELQANTLLNHVLFEVGFTWNKDKTVLYSPDGTKSWKLTVDKSTVAKAAKKLAEEAKAEQAKLNQTIKAEQEAAEEQAMIDLEQQADVPLSEQAREKLSQNVMVQEVTKNSMFKDDKGNLTVFYRSTERESDMKPSSKSEDTMRYKGFYSKPLTALESNARITKQSMSKLQGFITNLERSQVLVVNANGKQWNALTYKGKNTTTDKLVSQLLTEKLEAAQAKFDKTQPNARVIVQEDTQITKGVELPAEQAIKLRDDIVANGYNAYVINGTLEEALDNKKAILFRNVKTSEQETEGFGDYLVVFESDVLQRVTKEDNNQFVLDVTKAKAKGDIVSHAEKSFNYFVKKYTAEYESNVAKPKALPLVYQDVLRAYDVFEYSKDSFKLIIDPDTDFPKTQIVRKTDLKPVNGDASLITDNQRNSLLRWIQGDRRPFPKKKKPLDDEEANIALTKNIEDLVADMPITVAAAKDLAEEPANKTFLYKNGQPLFVSKSGMPIIFYRGFNSTNNAETPNYDTKAASAYLKGNKIASFLTTDWDIAKWFAAGMEERHTKGFITNVTRAETKIYDAFGLGFDYLKSIFTEADDATLKKYSYVEEELGNKIVVTPLEDSDEYDAYIDSGAEHESLLPTKFEQVFGSEDWKPYDFVKMKSLSKAETQTLKDTYKLTAKYIAQELNISEDWAEQLLFNLATRFAKKRTGSHFYTTDTLVVLNALQGYKAVYFIELDEGTGPITKNRTSNVLALTLQADSKKVSIGQDDLEWDKPLTAREKSRYVSNVVAKNSNLKYFIKKGQPIQLDPTVKNFVVKTTENFAKLPEVLRNKITAGTLNKFDIIDYVARARTMSDYTFKAVAEHVYENPELAKISFADFKVLREQVSDLAKISMVVDNPEVARTPDQMMATMKITNKKADANRELGEKLIKAQKYVENIWTSEGFIEVVLDPKQMLPIFMRHYDGTLDGMRSINNLAKLLAHKQTLHSLIENADSGEISAARSKDVYNWIDNKRIADVTYEDNKEQITDFEELNRYDKIARIEDLISNLLSDKIKDLLGPKPTDAKRQQVSEQLNNEFENMTKDLPYLSSSELNQRYLDIVIQQASAATDIPVAEIEKTVKAQDRSRKNIKDHIRQAANTITSRLGGLKSRFNLLPEHLKEAFQSKGYKLRTDYYTNMTNDQLENLLSDLKQAAKDIAADMRAKDHAAKAAKKLQERLDKMATKNTKLKEETVKAKAAKKTMREKIEVRHKTKIVNQNFTFDSREVMPKVAKEILNTQWGKTKMSEVQGITDNISQNVHNGETFFTANARLIKGMSLAEAEAVSRWFMDANIAGVAADSPEAQTFAAIKLYLLGYIFSQADTDGQFEGFDANLKNKLNDHLRTQATVAGTALSVWRNVVSIMKDPNAIMVDAVLQLDGVEVTEEEKELLAEAILTNNMNKIGRVQQRIIDRINKESTNKKSILKTITSLRSMSMLSSPITWLRNKVSNMSLKRLNKWSQKIGSKIFAGKTIEGQFKMDGKITPDIQKFINQHFLDNGFYDTIVANLSKYNPSDIQPRYKDATGKASATVITANMVIKALYTQYYNQKMFNNETLNKIHKFLMDRLSDNNYVREAAIRYFGKIVAERGYDLSRGVTDAVMNDFATAIGMATADYMHSDNFFNKLESMLAEKSDAALFVYKLILPFGSASWNWFKAAIRYSPIGLAQSIVRLSQLEQEITKAENNWAKGKGQVSPELTEYVIRRNLGSGVIGTTALLFGMILSMLGYTELEEDDYGVPKLRVGDIRVDVSSVFGSSSVLAGMALSNTLLQKGDFMEVLDAAIDPIVDGFFLVDLLTMDKYSGGGWASFSLGFVEQTLLSFIPNGVRWLSGATYTGTYKTNNAFERAVSRIPFFGSIFGLEKRVNPYDGSMGDALDIFNRIVPYLDIRQTSAIEDETKALGLNKTELRGQYEINGEAFNLPPAKVAELNRAYGQWNADTLTNFYANKTRHLVKNAQGKFQTLTYSQMTTEQRRNTVSNIMNKNAEYAKIKAWLDAGNTYYGSVDEYATLRRLGVSGNLYKGSRGYVKGAN